MSVACSYTSDYFDSKKYHDNRSHKIKKSGWLLDLALSFNPGINSVLEVGCSVGNTLEAAKKRNMQHLGIDVSLYAVEFCRNLGLQAENKSLGDLLEADCLFDLIFMQHVLEHFTNPFEVLDSCRKLLNKNGILVILVPNSRFGPAVRNRGKHRFYSLPGVGSEHFVYFDYPSLTQVLKSCGFRILQQNYPVGINKPSSTEFFLNRIVRRSLSLFDADQEILVLAQRNNN
jgi:2-polyprenyl-3-methyl-5-hydroxy-6-metoxy-1,4-benzoquinol methylase